MTRCLGKDALQGGRGFTEHQPSGVLYLACRRSDSRRRTSATTQSMKPMKKLKHSVYRLLNRPALRPVLAVLATIIATVRVGKLCKVSYESEWVHRFPSCTLVEPRLTLWTPQQIETLTVDLWMHQHRPSEGETPLTCKAAANPFCRARVTGFRSPRIRRDRF